MDCATAAEIAILLIANEAMNTKAMFLNEVRICIIYRNLKNVSQDNNLDIRFTGSVDAIRALNEGRYVMAGFHTLANPQLQTLTKRIYKPLLQPGLHKIIGFAQRTQGLMVTSSNPLNLNKLSDLSLSNNGKNPRFANRALGTGTRVVLDELLATAGLSSANIHGYDHTEPSHAAVAHAVLSGQADVGLGIEAAAVHAGLSFVPLVNENYHLVCLKSALEQPAILALRQLLQTPFWQAEISTLPGYAAQQSGEVLAMRKVLPWWDYSDKS